MRSRTIRVTGYALFDAILQLLRGIRIIKVFGGEEREARAALDKARLYFDELIEMVRIQSTAQVLLESLASLGLVLVIVIGGFEVMAGRERLLEEAAAPRPVEPPRAEATNPGAMKSWRGSLTHSASADRRATPRGGSPPAHHGGAVPLAHAIFR